MLQLIVVLVLVLPIAGLLIYAILPRSKGKNVPEQIPSSPDWYK
ncbi:MAG: hypothetical protein ABSA18_05820 [Dehalococcoidia bacterium]